jgi:glycosyltransferase involved in cell wall biosynthesis
VSDRIRIAFHAGQLLQPVPGGIGRYQRAMLQHLGDCGIDVVAFAAGARPPRVAPHVPWVDLGPPAGSVRYELWHRTRRPRVRLDTDLVHAPSLAIPAVSPGTPLVVTAHDVAFLRIPQVTTRRGVSFHRRGLEIAKREARLILVPSLFTQHELVREGFDNDRIAIVRFGIDPPAPRRDAEIDAELERAGVRPPYVLTVGTVEPRKDLPTIVRAVARLREQIPNLTFAVAGPRGWGEVPELDRSFVRVLGRQPWSAIDALYRRADAFCVASLYEGFGLPALEAMARGAATVTTTGSAMEEFVGGAGLLFEPRDTDACFAALARVLGDPAVRDEMRQRGQERAAELTWERSAEAHARAYARALSHARS